jgi:hypothetical protein
MARHVPQKNGGCPEAVLSGGRNSGQKLKRAQRKKVGRKNLWPNFAIKEPKKLFERISFFYSNDKHSETMTTFNYNFVDLSAERCFSFYVKIGRTFSRIGRTFFLAAS